MTEPDVPPQSYSSDIKAFPGDVRIEVCTIQSANGFQMDVIPQVISIEVYEDIFSHFISGRMILKDAVDLINLMPLVGEEILLLEFVTPNITPVEPFAGSFYIYKLDDRAKSAEREQIYVLHFVSIEAIADVNKKLSRTYEGKVSSIVQKMITSADALESPKKYEIEPTSNSTKYTSNFWTPAQNITYLSEQALNPSNNSPTYVFFENKKGFTFKSLDTLYQQDVSWKFKWDNYSADFPESNNRGGSDRDLNEDYKRILEYSTPENFNYIANLANGMYGSEMTTYDLTTKIYSHVTYRPSFNREHHLNKYRLYSDKLIAGTRALLLREHRYYNNFNGYGDVTNTKSKQRRIELMRVAEAYRVDITISGKTNYEVGKKIYLEFPLHAEILEKTDPQDKLLTGNYLIAALCHKIDRNKHECVIQAIKETFILDLNNVEHDITFHE